MGWFGHRNHNPSWQWCPTQRHKVGPTEAPESTSGLMVCAVVLIVCRRMQMFWAVLYLGVGLSYSHSHRGKVEITIGDDITLVIGYSEELASFIEWGKHEMMKWTVHKWKINTSFKFSPSSSHWVSQTLTWLGIIVVVIVVNIYWGLTLCQALC